ncbi:MAG TPA: hypothetical protein VLC48_05355 [Gemmatimonadota bacterium]|nr:hypothetical protein [Gemmatimonadota bacterium]
MNGKSRVWASALLGIAFLVGGVAGASVDRLLVRPNATADARERRSADDERDRRGGYIDWLAAELQLSDEQRVEVEAIVQRHQELLSDVWREMRPRYEELREQARADIKAVLTQEQLEAYEALLAEEAERRQSRRGHDRS